MKKERNNYTAQEKVAILRRHLLDKVPVPAPTGASAGSVLPHPDTVPSTGMLKLPAFWARSMY